MWCWTGDDVPFYYTLANTFPLADRWLSAAAPRLMASASLDLPAPGGPVMPTTCARLVCAYSRLMASGSSGARFSTRVIRRQRQTVAGEDARDQTSRDVSGHVSADREPPVRQDAGPLT
jgi:hypothetical protein